MAGEEKHTSVREDYSTLEVSPVAERLAGGNLEVRPIAESLSGGNAQKYGHFAEDLPLGQGNAQPVFNNDPSQAPEVVEKAAYYAPSYQTDTPTQEPSILKEEPDDVESTEATKHARVCGLPKKTAVILLGVLIAVIVVAAILGGALGGTIGQRKSAPPSSGGESNSEAPTPSATPSTVRNAYPLPTTSDYVGMRTDSSIAASSHFNTNNDDEWQYSVYYQDENNLIKESAWNWSSNTWTISTLNYTSNPAKPGTKLAAAATILDGAALLNVFYVDAGDKIKGLELNKADILPEWKTGRLDGYNLTINTDGNLAAVFDDCNDVCSENLYLFWQNQNFALELANATVNREVNTATIVNSTVAGASFSINAFAFGNERQRYQLYLPTDKGELSRIQWSPTNVSSSTNVTGQGWSTASVQSLGPISTTNVSIASYQFGKLKPQGIPQAMQILNTMPEGGLNVTNWVGKENNGQGKWTGNTTPSAFRNDVGPGSKIAANANKQVFAITKDMKIAQYTVDDDGLSWTKVGEVPTK